MKKFLLSFMVILTAFSLLNYTVIYADTTSELSTITIKGDYNYDLANEVFTLVNEERANEGVASLEYSAELMKIAMLRAAETSIYWSHERPDATLCFSISDLVYGENIAIGQKTASGVMNSWMNSEGHRANILKEGYESIGIGCYQLDGTTFWVQVFSYTDSTDTTKIEGITKNVENKVQVKANDGRLTLSILGLDSDMTLNLGETKTATKAYITNKTASSVKPQISLSDIEWTSSDESVFTVDSDGKITAVDGGNAVLSAILGESTLTYNISVEVPLESISLDTNVILSLNFTKKLEVTYNPTNTTSSKNVTWSSSNTSVASVDSNGIVTALKEGTATITATVDGKKATSQITVVKYLKGDINKDGKVNMQDVYYGMKGLSKKTLTDEEKEIGEVTGDSKFTMSDVYKIMKYVSKKISVL